MVKTALITGGSGLLALNWALAIKGQYNVVLALHNRDIEVRGVKTIFFSLDDKESIKKVFQKYSPDIVIHTVGLTNIEECEKDKELAKYVNVKLAKNIATVCRDSNVKLVHISTDHLFSGIHDFSTETEKCSPLNIYAKTKLDAEQSVLEIYSQSLIVRTNFFCWGTSYRHSLSDKIIQALRNNESIELFHDIFFTPILASELAIKVHKLIDINATGIFNVVGNERLSKYEFGIKLAHAFKLNGDLIRKNSIKEYAKLTLRPKDMSLSNNKYSKVSGERVKTLVDQFLDLASQEKRHFSSISNTRKIPYGRHYLDEDDIESVVDVLRSGNLTQGTKVTDFEHEVSQYVGAKYAVSVSSGTAALHLAALVAGVGPGNSIVTSPITFVASANVALYTGGKVVFSDIDSQSINMSPEGLKQTIKENDNIRAIIPVHFAGLPCDMLSIKLEADKVGAIVIEDAAHAFGAKYPDDKRVGCCTHSHMTIFSFHPVKSIATGEGGMITTNDEKIYRKLLRLRSHGVNKLDDPLLLPEQAEENGSTSPWYYEMQELGFNYRLTDIQCALGLSQLKKIEKFISRRQELVKNYDKALSNMRYCRPAQNASRDYSSHHLYVILIDFNKIGKSRSQFMKEFEGCGIGSQVHYIPVPIHPFYRKLGFKLENYPNAQEYYKEALSIPLYYGLSDPEQQQVINSLKKLLG